MNEKVMNVFNKNNEQLDKELARRGIPLTTCHHPYNKNKICSRERAIAEIIYKDAFDCGRSEAGRTCPEGCKGKPIYKLFRLYDITDDRIYRLELTLEQYQGMKWLINVMELDFELTEWEEESFVDVGQIG